MKKRALNQLGCKSSPQICKLEMNNKLDAPRFQCGFHNWNNLVMANVSGQKLAVPNVINMEHLCRLEKYRRWRNGKTTLSKVPKSNRKQLSADDKGKLWVFSIYYIRNCHFSPIYRSRSTTTWLTVAWGFHAKMLGFSFIMSFRYNFYCVHVLCLPSNNDKSIGYSCAVPHIYRGRIQWASNTYTKISRHELRQYTLIKNINHVEVCNKANGSMTIFFLYKKWIIT